MSEASEKAARGAADAPTSTPWLRDIAVYHGGESAIAGVDRVVKLSSNENPFGPSSRAVEAYRRAADSLNLYPDGSAADLRGAVAAVHDVDPDRIVCGAGSDELISMLCRAFCAPGDEIIYSQYGFAMYPIAAQTVGARPVAAPETDLTADVDALLSKITDRTRIVFLANPNNPTGTYLDSQQLERLISRVPSNVVLALDGAYAEYMRDPSYEPGLSLVDRRANVVALRTFSKIYGLAALRLGWCYAPSGVVDALHRVRGPFNVSAPALAAGVAAIRDVDYTENCAIQNEVWRDWLIKELRAAGVDTPQSWGNFVLPRFGESGPTSAAAADAFLRSKGLITRRMESYGLPAHLRITVGASGDNVAVAQAIRELMRGAGRSGAGKSGSS